MNPILSKLRYKDQVLHLIHPPASFEPGIHCVLDGLANATNVTFLLAFCTRKAEVDALAGQIAGATVGDAIVWIAYPKGTSKRFQCDFHRDNGWDKIGHVGFEPVTQVAIDEDWSALRFRRTEYIKSLERRSAISAAGKQRIAKRS